MFSIEVVSLALVIIINLVVALVIASQSWHTKVNRYFVLAVALVIVWAIGTLLLVVGSTSNFIEVGRLLFLIAPMYTILFLSLFAAVFPQIKGRSFTYFNMFLAALTVVFSLFIAIDPTRFISEVTVVSDAYNKITVDAFWYSIYVVYFNTAFLITFTEFFLHIRHSRGHQRQRLLYVFSGTLLAAAFSLVTNLILPVFGVSQFIWLGPTWTLFYIVTISISIVKHQLFDIKLAVVRSIAYIGVSLTLSLIYYFFAYVISVLIIGSQTTTAISVNPVNIFLALVLAFLFQPIKSFFDQVTNNIFYRDRYNSEAFFGTLSNLLSVSVDLRGLLERASTQISSTFKAEQTFFFVSYTHDGEHHVSAGTTGHARIPADDVRMLDQHSKISDEKIFLAEMLSDEESQLRRMLLSHRVELVMPLRLEDKIVGYVFLGERRSGNYTKRDIEVLSAISSELVIAIQNALSLHELKELNATLQQRINVATKELRASNNQLKHLDEIKDEFISMASHQLRTPLTSVKGYLSMVLDGDVGDVAPKQQALLREAFNSSERMVRLIADFLNVSRLQTGKFTLEKQSIDIKTLINGEIANLDVIAKAHRIKFRLNITEKDLPLVADESKIQQVVMNFIDNAIYYSRPNSTVIITLERVKNDVAYTVVDTGIGVPEEEQSKLFHKFYRAKNARKQRPDGTGVGLFMARRVIEAHKGQIIFSSKENKGSTFGFRLPLSVDAKVLDDSSVKDDAKK